MQQLACSATKFGVLHAQVSPWVHRQAQQDSFRKSRLALPYCLTSVTFANTPRYPHSSLPPVLAILSCARHSARRSICPDFSALGMLFSLAWMHRRDPAGYPVGGSLRFAEGIARRYADLGAEVQYRPPVEKTLVEPATRAACLVLWASGYARA